MKNINIFTMCLIVLLSIFAKAQNTKDNFYEYTQNMDAYFSALKSTLPDTVKVPGLKMYERYKYFWANRVYSNDTIQGDYSKYIEKMQQYFQNPSIYPLPITSNTWEFVGPKNISTHNQGIIVSLHIDPNNIDNILAGTNASGMFKTTNGGQNWINVTDNILMPGLGVMDIAVNPQNQSIVYIGSGNDFNNYGAGIFKSTDGCQTWQQVLAFNPDDRKLVRKLLINPQNPNILFAAVNDKIYRSFDAGANWEIIFSDLLEFEPNHYDKNKYITEIKFRPNDFNTIYISTVGIKSLENPTPLMSAELWVTHNAQEINPQNVVSSRITNGLPAWTPRIAIATSQHNQNQLFIGYREGNQFHLKQANYPNYNLINVFNANAGGGYYQNFSDWGIICLILKFHPQTLIFCTLADII